MPWLKLIDFNSGLLCNQQHIMKILYDHQGFQQFIGGVSRYYVEAIKRLDSNIEYEVAIKYSRNIYIRDILPGISYPFGKLYIPFKRRLINKANFNYAITRLIESHYDLFHATFDDSYFLPYVKTPFIIDVHDLIPESEPNLWPSTWLASRKEVFPKAAHILVNSQYTKDDLLHHYPNLDESKISIIYRGYVPSIVKMKPLIKGRYILYVGGRDGYKNFNKFIQACAPILAGENDLKLFCTANKFSKEEKNTLSQLNIAQKVFHIQADESQLRNLYQNAIMLVFPSLKEGFGLPILEAWGNNCPVVVSNASCLPEIAGDAAIYSDPLDINSIRDVVLQVLKNQDLREDLIKRGNERLKLFTWESSAKKLEEMYKKILFTK